LRIQKGELMKKIDIVDVKKAIKDGKLQVYNMGNDIYFKDVETEEVVLIGKYKGVKND